ncbi:MAG: TIGR00296 family protein [Candidatus Lokiarchaeota archaeon]|nr:TIGR00296 family protein [Candidatus Lokiarchaeota archaeon]
MEHAYSDKEGEIICKTARRAVDAKVKENKKIPIPEDIPEILKRASGIFVTLNKIAGSRKPQLRGCIGHPYPDKPLIEATVDSAISAALRDPRFPPVRPDELNNIIVETTILTPPKKIEVKNPEEYLDKIKIGRDGLIVSKGFNKGLLLPQVPVEWNWDKKEYLNHTCMKAGLPPDSWKLKDIEIQKFQGEIFKEAEPYGEIVRKKIE